MDSNIEELEKKINDLRKRMPAHSARPWMVQELEDLEEELAEARERDGQKPPGEK